MQKLKIVLLSIVRLLPECAIYILDIGILVFLYDSTESGAIVSSFYVSQLLPAFVIVFAGCVIDRYGKKWLLSASYFLISFLLSFLLWNRSVVGILLITVAMNFLFEFNRSTWDALLPEMVAKDELLHMSSVINLIDSVAMIAAPLIATLIVSTSSVDVIIWITMMLFMITGVLYFFLRTDSSSVGIVKAEGERLKSFQLKEVFGDKELRTIAIYWILFMMMLGLTTPLEIMMIEQVLQQPSAYFGFGNAVEGVGMLVAASLVVGLYRKLTPWLMISVGFMVSGFSYLIIGFAPNIYVYMLGALLVGVTASFAPMGFRVAVQTSSPLHAKGRAFTSIRFLTLIARMMGTMLVSVLILNISIRMVYGLVTVILLLLGGGLLLKKGKKRADQLQ